MSPDADELIEGMVRSTDGRHGIMIDPKNGHYGWIFGMHPDGMWVSVRKASTVEMAAAEHHHNELAGFSKVFQNFTHHDGTSPMAKLALVDDQVVGRVYHDPLPVRAHLNSLGLTLPDNAPLYARPRDPIKRYVRVPPRKDPKYHEEWPEIEGGPVFDGQAYCRDLFEALRLAHVILAETMPEGAVE